MDTENQARPAPAHLLGLPLSSHQPGGAPPPLIGHKIGHVLGVARSWEPRQVHTEVPGEQRHVLGRGQKGPPCGGERGHEVWSHSEQCGRAVGCSPSLRTRSYLGWLEYRGCDVGWEPGVWDSSHSHATDWLYCSPFPSLDLSSPSVT